LKESELIYYFFSIIKKVPKAAEVASDVRREMIEKFHLIVVSALNNLFKLRATDEQMRIIERANGSGNEVFNSYFRNCGN
jgi:ATP-dependent RNA circularization protein (DNA/RNA ligase family)